MRIATFRFGGSGTQKWNVLSDTVIVGAKSAKQFLVTTDPTLTITGWNTPGPGTSELDSQLILTNDVDTQLMTNLAFPIEAGTTLYVTILSAGNVQLYLEDSLI